MAPKKNNKRKASESAPSTSAADKATEPVSAEPARSHLTDRATEPVPHELRAMPPKTNGKRKASESSIAASASDRAPEPVVAASASDTTTHTGRGVAMPDLKDLPGADAVILTQVQLLGHHPRSLNADALGTTTQERIEEKLT